MNCRELIEINYNQPLMTLVRWPKAMTKIQLLCNSMHTVQTKWTSLPLLFYSAISPEDKICNHNWMTFRYRVTWNKCLIPILIKIFVSLVLLSLCYKHVHPTLICKEILGLTKSNSMNIQSLVKLRTQQIKLTLTCYCLLNICLTFTRQ